MARLVGQLRSANRLVTLRGNYNPGKLEDRPTYAEKIGLGFSIGPLGPLQVVRSVA